MRVGWINHYMDFNNCSNQRKYLRGLVVVLMYLSDQNNYCGVGYTSVNDVH